MRPENKLTQTYFDIRRTLASTVSRIVPPKDIEDIVQETYVKVCQLENAHDIDDPKSYLIRTAMNLALDQIKRAENQRTEQVENIDELLVNERGQWPSETFDKAASNEEFALFCSAARQLPVQCRRVFLLKKVYGFSQREISHALNLSESTVEKHVALGLKRCALFMRAKTQHELSTAAVKSHRSRQGKNNAHTRAEV